LIERSDAIMISNSKGKLLEVNERLVKNAYFTKEECTKKTSRIYTFIDELVKKDK
jgi:hypothetical protein